MKENIIKGIKNRVLQFFARFLPGSMSVRVLLHRMRGVNIGKGAWLGYDDIFETACPYLIYIGNNVTISMHVLIIAHFEYDETVDPMSMYRDKKYSVRIEDNAFIGPGVIILPNVKIGEGSVVTAGSVVSRSIPAHVMVRGNPAKPIAKCPVSLSYKNSYQEFKRNLKPLRGIKKS